MYSDHLRKILSSKKKKFKLQEAFIQTNFQTLFLITVDRLKNKGKSDKDLKVLFEFSTINPPNSTTV